jgi:hypothetical protein
MQEVWNLIEADSESIQENYATQGTNEQVFMVLLVQNPTQVKVPNGGVLHSTDEMLSAEWFIQDWKF